MPGLHRSSTRSLASPSRRTTFIDSVATHHGVISFATCQMPHVLAIATRSHTEAVAKEIGQMLDRREAGRDIWTRTSCRWPPEESPQCGFLCLRYASSSVDVPHRGVGLLTKDFVGSNDRHDQGEKQKFACLLRSDRRPALRLFHDDSRTPSGETDRRKFPASRSLLRSHRLMSRTTWRQSRKHVQVDNKQ